MAVALRGAPVVPNQQVVVAVLLISLHRGQWALPLGTMLITSIHVSSLPVAAVVAEKTPVTKAVTVAD